MVKKWKSILAEIAPLAGAALGTPLGGIGLKIIANKLGLKADAKEKDIRQAIENLTPEQATRLHEADADLEKHLATIEVDKERLLVEDRADARANNRKGDMGTPRNLTYIMAVGFFGNVVVLAAYGGKIDGSILAVLTTLMGALARDFGTVISYWFGSSRGSKAKTDALIKRP